MIQNRASLQLNTAKRSRLVILLQRICTFLFTLVVALLPAPTTAALDDATWDFFAANGIYYYDPDGTDSLNECVTFTDGSNVTIIGDFLISSSSAAILELLPQANLYADGAKQFGAADDEALNSSTASGLSILKYLLNSGELQPTIVFALGSNHAPLTQDQIDALLETVGSNYNVFLVTNFDATGTNSAHYNTNNSLFSTAAENSNIHIIDWAAAADDDPEQYLDETGTHPTEAGQQLLAELISNAVGGSTSASSGLNGDFTDYAGRPLLTDSQITQLQKNIPTYEQAIKNTGADQYGINWQFIATLHYREIGFSRSNPPNGQGLYGFYSYTNSTGILFTPGPVSDAEFLRQTELAITEVVLPNMRANGISDLSDDGNVKRLFFSFNGIAQQYIDKALAMGFTQEEANNGEGSTYVMNFYDARRDHTSPDMDPNWPGRYVYDGVYDPTSVSEQYGAFTVYDILRGSNACVTVSSGGLTLEQARRLMNDYIYNVNCYDYNMYCTHGSSGGPKANCVSFVQYFIDRFTSVHDLSQQTGDGGWVVSNLTGKDFMTPGGLYVADRDYSSKGFTDGGFTPKPYAVFSTFLSSSTPCGGVICGHTGIVLGINEAADEIYIGQTGYNTPLDSTFVTTIVYPLSEYTSGNYWYAYLDDIIDLTALSEVVGR